MNTKYYLIGAFTNGSLAQNYFDSLPVLGENVVATIIQYQHKGVFDPVTVPENVTLVKIKKEYPGNTGKHKDFRELISPLLKDDDWYVVTDMHDVVFQAAFPAFWKRTDVDMFVASEAVKFRDVKYWEIFPPYVNGWDVYNVGCFAMRGQALHDFWEYIYTNWMQFYEWYKQAYIARIGNGDTFPFNIPFHEKVKIDMAVMFNSHYDTLAFNEFIRKRRHVDLYVLFGCYAYQVQKGIVECKDGKLYRDGKLTTVAHYNGHFKDKFLKRKEGNK